LHFSLLASSFLQFIPLPNEQVGHVAPRPVLGAVIMSQGSAKIWPGVKILWTVSATVAVGTNYLVHMPLIVTLLQVVPSHSRF
jgi:hypothetical protein